MDDVVKDRNYTRQYQLNTNPYQPAPTSSEGVIWEEMQYLLNFLNFDNDAWHLTLWKINITLAQKAKYGTEGPCECYTKQMVPMKMCSLQGLFKLKKILFYPQPPQN